MYRVALLCIVGSLCTTTTGTPHATFPNVTERVDDEDLPPAYRNLDAKEQERLRVSWGKAVRVGGGLQVSCKLSLLEADGKTLKPVDWPLPISVIFCKRAKARLEQS